MENYVTWDNGNIILFAIFQHHIEELYNNIIKHKHTKGSPRVHTSCNVYECWRRIVFLILGIVPSPCRDSSMRIGFNEGYRKAQ